MTLSRPLLCLCLALLLSAVSSALAGPVVGWRTDGTGKYPTATPPLQWGPDKGILWSTPIPAAKPDATGNSTPVLVGDRLFICSEPANLLCFSATDGKLLWQRSNDFKDLATAEEAANLQATNEQATALRVQLMKTWGQIQRLQQDLKDKPDDAALKEQLEAAKLKAKEIQDQLKPLNELWYVFPKTYPINGFSTPTPVSDGRYVYTLTGHGVAACYDLDGALIWRRFLEKPVNEYGHSSSPIIADGKLIIHVLNLTALDPATGKEIWKVRLPESWGTPRVARIGEVELIVTPAGDIVRASDGKPLARNLCRLDYGDPIIDGDKLYFHTGEVVPGKAFQLPATIDESSFKPTELWTSNMSKDRRYCASLLHEGLIYSCTRNGVFSAIDAANGKVIYEQPLGGKPTFYTAVTLAGGYLFVANESGTVFVLKPGRTFEQVGQNTLEPFRSCPVFVGNKLYLRGAKTLYCIGG